MKNPGRKLFTVSLIIVLFLTTCLFSMRIRPAIKKYCTLEVESAIRNIINYANEVVLSKKYPYEILFNVVENADKEITYVSANSGLINQISMLWATEIQKGIDNKQTIVMEKPFGCFLGSAFLADFGRKIRLEIIYSATSRTQYQSVFIQQGVNQTIHRLYLTAYVDAQIITPYKSEKISVDETYLFCETILNGKVPSTYIASADQIDYLDLIE